MVSKNHERLIATAVFILTGLTAGVFVFLSENEGSDVREIFNVNYLVPFLAYSSGPVIISFLIYSLLKKKYPA